MGATQEAVCAAGAGAGAAAGGHQRCRGAVAGACCHLQPHADAAACCDGVGGAVMIRAASSRKARSEALPP